MKWNVRERRTSDRKRHGRLWAPIFSTPPASADGWPAVARRHTYSSQNVSNDIPYVDLDHRPSFILFYFSAVDLHRRLFNTRSQSLDSNRRLSTMVSFLCLAFSIVISDSEPS